MAAVEALQRRMGAWAAGLMVAGLLTGIYVSAAMTGKVPADPHMALAAHLNALLGCFWIIAVAWSMPLMRYSAPGRARLSWLIIIPNVANWAVTAWKAWWKVSGIDAIGEVRNDTIFGLLTVLVVLPSLVGAVAWLSGFSGQPFSR